MSANKTYQYELWSEFYNCNQTEIIAFYVENIVLVAYIINRIESPLHVSKRTPVGILHFLRPVLKCSF